MDGAIKALLKFGIGFFIGVCILLWAFQPGHTWVYFILIAFVVYILAGKVFSRNGAFLVLLLIFVLYLLRYSAIDNGIQSIGRAFPKKAVDKAAQTTDKLMKGKTPYGNIGDTVKAGNKMDQNDINQCLRDVVARDSQKFNDRNLAVNSQVCAQKTGKDFQTCMQTNVFDNPANDQETLDGYSCSGASTGTGQATQDKIDNLGKGAALTVVCDIFEFANYFPWVNLPTDKCPD